MDICAAIPSQNEVQHLRHKMSCIHDKGISIPKKPQVIKKLNAAMGATSFEIMNSLIKILHVPQAGSKGKADQIKCYNALKRHESCEISSTSCLM